MKWFRRDKRSRVQVNYKSGAFMVFRVEDFTVKTNRLNGARSYEWSNASPNPLLFNADEVESVWEL